jgi:Fe-S oxidoreductase
MAVDMNLFRGFVEQIRMLPQMAQPTDYPDSDRVQAAKQVFEDKLNARLASHLDACVHCGICAEACHYYVQSGDPGYTPVHKLELIRRYYRRERGAFAWLYRLFIPDITEQDLEQWQPLVYDGCTECGRCSMVCPQGVDIASMVGVMRQALAKAGLIPAGLRAVEQEQGSRGTVFGVGPDELMQALEALRKKGHEIPLDKDHAEMLVLTSTLDVLLFSDALESTVKVLNHLGIDWTIHRCAFEGANFGMLSGFEEVQKQASERIVAEALRVGARYVIVPECGHAYPAMRWEAANEHGAPLPFEVLAISEFLGREVMAGRLVLDPLQSRTVTYHDPCKIGRHGGVFDEPRAVLEALGLELEEMPAHREMNYCCGGGAGLFLIESAAHNRDLGFDLKRQQVESTAAESLVTACGSCRLNFLAGADRVGWDRDVESLIELVGQALPDPGDR